MKLTTQSHSKFSLRNAVKALLPKRLFCEVNANKPSINAPFYVNLFGLPITNVSMTQAVNWVTNKPNPLATKVGLFVNVNSINQSLATPALKTHLRQADALFADGIGMRIAAHHQGYELQDNVNGTDMLPLLCQQCVNHQRSVYLLGGADGIAHKTASQLKQRFPNLKIAGSHHGYIDEKESEELIQQINESQCDILLVAMGTPIQESWIMHHKDALQCRTILGVGGLFDFYSGAITRAPMMVRRLNAEWCWRLAMEPVKKFKRYVIGNPLFLFRTYVLGLANKGEK